MDEPENHGVPGSNLLQPGQYGNVRNGQVVASNPVKYLQNNEIARHARTG
jgi:hypothetical protein